MPRVVELPIGVVEVHCSDYPAPDPAARTKVIDGDTFVVGGQKWRLSGWDAPPVGPIGTVLTRNTGKHPHCPKELEMGWAAKRLAEELLADSASRGTLRVEILAGPKDAHQRWLVRIWIDGIEMGQLMAEHGLAEPYNGSLPKWGFCDCEERRTAYDEQLEKQREARRELSQRRQGNRRIA
jgi:endonuclease YncB( thermonuclease family)